MDETGEVFQKLRELLHHHGITYTQLSHRPVYTSAEAAEVRGTPLHSGAKALIMKGDDGFAMAILPADCDLDGTALRKLLGSRRLRFATKEELEQLTGLTPGSIPPFGSLFGLSTICDTGLGDNLTINFNAGSHSHSIQMSYADYLAVEAPRIATIARPAGGMER